jgi:hypothetical protein
MDQQIAMKRPQVVPVKRPRGRPPGDSTQVNVSIPRAQLDDLDAWIRKQERPIGHPEAIRRLIAQTCGGLSKRRRRRREL